MLEVYRHAREGVTSDGRSGTLAIAPMHVVVTKRTAEGVDFEVTSFEVAEDEHVLVHCHELSTDGS